MRVTEYGKFNIPFSEALRHRAQRKHLTQSFFASEKTLRGFRGRAPRKFVS